jgi:hypothetical protein
MPDWDLKEWLEAFAYLMAVVVPFVGAIVYLLRKRKESLKALTRDLARSWTNEGRYQLGGVHFSRPRPVTR